MSAVHNPVILCCFPFARLQFSGSRSEHFIQSFSLDFTCHASWDPNITLDFCVASATLMCSYAMSWLRPNIQQCNLSLN